MAEIKSKLTPWRLIAAILLCAVWLLPTAIALEIIPSETAPRVDQAAGGVTDVVFTDLQLAVLGVVFPLSLVIGPFVVVGSMWRILAAEQRRVAPEPPTLSRGQRLGLRILISLVTLLFSCGAILLLYVATVSPYRDIRALSVDPNGVVLKSVFTEWFVDPSEIEDVTIVEDLHGARDRASVDRRIEILLDDGRTFQSRTITAQPPGGAVDRQQSEFCAEVKALLKK